MYIQTANRTTIPNISVSRLKEFIIPLPSLGEQQQIASILSSIDKRIDAEEQKNGALEQLFNSFLHNLMSGKIRVKNLKMQEVKNG
jgi:type I restriction enzyme S subunit